MKEQQLEITEQDTAMVLAPKPELVPPSPLSILNTAVQKGADIDTIERLVALQEKMLARDAEIGFNEALNRVQSEIKRVAPDMENTHTHSKYATYQAIDKVIRPIYSKEGFSISFTHAECSLPDYIRVVCRVARGAHKEHYQVDWPVDTKGPKGNDVVTKTQATGISDSYAKRYLVKDIFNIAIGEDDTDGNAPNPDWFDDHLTAIKNSSTLDELQKSFSEAWRAVKGDKKLEGQLITAKNTRRGQICK